MDFFRRLFQPPKAAQPAATTKTGATAGSATSDKSDKAGVNSQTMWSSDALHGLKTAAPPTPEIAEPGLVDNKFSAAPPNPEVSLADGVQIDPAPTPPTMALAGGVTRPLPPLELQPFKPGRHLIYGLSSDIGQTRTNNQDSLFALFCADVSVEDKPDLALFAVADGMGGHSHGEKASAIAVRTVAQQMVSSFYLDILGSESAAPSDPDKPPIAELLAEAMQKANVAVSEAVPEGGTTLTVVAIMGDMAYIGHVGDSRAYLLIGDRLEQITRDHSLVQRLVELDQLTPEEAAVHMQRNVLYRAIGQSETLEIDALVRRLPPSSRLVICSDGLWNLVPEEMLVEIIRGSTMPQEACDRLIEVANQRGGLDNITAILIQTPG